MSRKTVGWGIALLVVIATGWFGTSANAQGGKGQPNDWNRFYYYPYVYYPENFQPLQSYDNMYYRYPQNRQIPVYNQAWHNEYPSPRPYHKGHAFILDVF
ncbi:MAG: hypothetical protein U0903_07965 [Planctomycetales bacterium]